MVMKSIFSTPGKTTMPTQPAVQQSPTMKPAASTLTGTGTPWQRGTRGMDRVKMPGVNSYAPQRPATPPGGVQSLSRPAQPTSWGGANDPRLNSANNAAYNSGMSSGANGGQQGLPNLVDVNAMRNANRPPPTGQGGLFSAPQGQQPQGNISSRLFAQPGGATPTAMGFGGVGVAPTGDTSTWDAGDWYRYNKFQQQQQNPLAAALSNYNTGG